MIRIRNVLEPLAIAANVSQAAHTRLDHILLTLGNLFRQYSDSESTAFDEDLRLGVLKSLEKRWKKVDQDIFIVAVFLNPYIRAKLFKQQFLTEAQLYNIVEQLYERLMRCTADLGFMDAFDDYKRSRENVMKFSTGYPLDLQLFGHLAMHIFAVVANSAGCERAFSNFGITHTKRRNKIDAIRVHKMAVVGMEQKRVDQEAGLARNRKKRNLESESMDFRQYAENLIQQARISRNDDDHPDIVTPQPTIPTSAIPNPSAQPQVHVNSASSASSTSSRKTDIPLAKLFNYTLSPEDGLEFYWPGSKKNLEADLLAHELCPSYLRHAARRKTSQYPSIPPNTGTRWNATSATLFYELGNSDIEHSFIPSLCHVPLQITLLRLKHLISDHENGDVVEGSSGKKSKKHTSKCSNREKLDLFFAFLQNELNWTYDELLFYVYNSTDLKESRSENFTTKWYPHQHVAVLQHFLHGCGSFTSARIRNNWLHHPYGRDERESPLMYTTSTSYLDIKPVRPALTSFAAQIVANAAENGPRG
ncbi:hypothetical protein BDZ97DRAFT_2074991 [Flammula alnicola]|nr:hypothetical protein BDZ97DRAFT_2074991 [Flammula alnicola]